MGYSEELAAMPRVFVVLKRRGDGYHTWDPELIVAYFDEDLARRHAQQKSEYDYEMVPLAPQLISNAEE